jgi:CheY-like chemotaxis protein
MDTEHPNTNPYRCVRILIVEDDELQAQVLQIGLTVSGFTVDIVTNGLAAVEVVQDKNYDAVLVDYNIPEMDGLATARLLGDFLGPIARPILIALTATPGPLTERDRGAGSAFDLILDKSSDLASIIVAITRCLENAPDSAAKRAAKDLIYDQAEEDYVMGRGHPGADGDNPGPVRILVVEDDDSQRLLLSNMLRNRGYAVETVSNGLAAVRRIRENCCDLALVDYDLPEIDGVAVANLVHDQMAQAWRPRLIALTATPDLLHIRAAITGPVFDQIIDKSAGFDELIGSVDHLLRCSPDPETRRAAAHVLPIAIRPAAFPI